MWSFFLCKMFYWTSAACELLVVLRKEDPISWLVHAVDSLWLLFDRDAWWIARRTTMLTACAAWGIEIVRKPCDKSISCYSHVDRMFIKSAMMLPDPYDLRDRCLSTFFFSVRVEDTWTNFKSKCDIRVCFVHISNSFVISSRCSLCAEYRTVKFNKRPPEVGKLKIILLFFRQILTGS